jgi:hypothetical protein
MSTEPTNSETSSASAEPLTAEAAAAELKRNYTKIGQSGAFFHEREKTMMLSILVTEWSVMNEIPLTNGKYKGFEIIWGFYIPEGVAVQ